MQFDYESFLCKYFDDGTVFPELEQLVIRNSKFCVQSLFDRSKQACTLCNIHCMQSINASIKSLLLCVCAFCANRLRADSWSVAAIITHRVGFEREPHSWRFTEQSAGKVKSNKVTHYFQILFL